MVMVAVSVPLPEQLPEVVIATGKPEEAVATTLKLEPFAALAGAEVVTVMVWLAGVMSAFVVVELLTKL